jgi:hypothetical protein
MKEVLTWLGKAPCAGTGGTVVSSISTTWTSAKSIVTPGWQRLGVGAGAS